MSPEIRTAPLLLQAEPDTRVVVLLDVVIGSACLSETAAALLSFVNEV
jgi:hypothetical protein